MTNPLWHFERRCAWSPQDCVYQILSMWDTGALHCVNQAMLFVSFFCWGLRWLSRQQIFFKMMPSNPNQMVPGPPGMVPMQNQNVPSPSNMNMVPMGPQGGPPMPGQPMVPVNQAGPPMNQPPPPQGPPGSHQASNNQPGQQHDLSRLRNLICLLKDSLAVRFFLSLSQNYVCFHWISRTWCELPASTLATTVK